jgi:hypothetical protein
MELDEERVPLFEGEPRVSLFQGEPRVPLFEDEPMVPLRIGAGFLAAVRMVQAGLTLTQSAAAELRTLSTKLQDIPGDAHEFVARVREGIASVQQFIMAVVGLIVHVVKAMQKHREEPRISQERRKHRNHQSLIC